VLVVDHHPSHRQSLVMQLHAWGLHPVTVGSCQEALDLIGGAEPFDLAILDMQLPEMNGLALAAEIRQQRDAAALPLVLLTRFGEQIRSPQRKYVFGALTKPVKPAQLYDMLMDIFVYQQPAWDDDPVVDWEGPRDSPAANMATRLPLRLLMVEDNLINQEVLAGLLGMLGYHADIAANGLEALAALRSKVYDLVLMDVQMPQMDGLEATRCIRSEFPPDQQPHIVAVTANAMQDEREQCLAAGMNDYLSKPINFKQLAAAIEQIGTSGATAAASEPAPQLLKDSTSLQMTYAPDHGVLDVSALERLNSALGDRAVALLPSLIATFFENADQLRAAARAAGPQSSADSLRRAAHTLKSNSDLFGALTLAGLCRDLERRAVTGALDDADDLLSQIDAELERVRSALGDRFNIHQ
jgi:CheY-like chemotaxis protein/HPt (histidine-containing phosphotransfer) domain-containing protein